MTKIDELKEPYDAPKQLEIRNSPGGMIWQVYHVNNEFEKQALECTARKNGFGSVQLAMEVDNKETWPGWRNTDDWKLYVDTIEKGEIHSNIFFAERATAEHTEPR